MVDLGIDQPVRDPTMMSPEELLGEIRDITKKLLAYGARFPKVLMLYVKDMLFIDGALATLAPDIDLFEEVTRIAMYFTARHGERIAAEVGIDPRATAVDLDGLRASLGVPSEVEAMSYRDLQERRQLIRKRMRDHHKAKHSS
jgi:ubiquinone biosynthesis protein